MKQHTSWVEVDKSAIVHNLKEIKRKINPDRILAVIKANAYGHGAVEIARLLLKNEINYLGVALAEEALELRKNGIAAPIIVLSPVIKEMLLDLIKANCTLTVSSLNQLIDINAVAKKLDKSANVHLNIDTGMNRYGLDPKDVKEIIDELNGMNNVVLEGIFTHFAQAENSKVTNEQFDIFIDKVQLIKNNYKDDLIIHCANSIATLKYQKMRLDMVRIGSLIFGNSKISSNLDLKRSWCLKSKIVHIKKVNEGQGISYGAEYIAKKNMKIAIVPLGFYQGISMWPNHTSVSLKTATKNVLKELLKLRRVDRVIEKAYFGEKELHYLGKTGMEHIALDITDCESISVGDIVVLRTLQTAVNQSVPIVYKEV